MNAYRVETRTRQVRRVLAERITSGALGPTGRLPSTRTLAREFGVSRSTVLAALDLLVAEGYVESQPRRGLFATDVVRTRARPEPETGRAPELPWRKRMPESTLMQPLPPTRWWEAPYPFITGQLDADLFPQRSWVRAVRRAHEPAHVQWTASEHGGDDPLLVEQICGQLLPVRGISATPGQVVVTLGSQQALAALAALLLGPGSVAAIEDPGYPDARVIARSRGARVVPVAVDAEGMSVRGCPVPAQLIYVTPSHQHPTNVTMSLPRRLELLAVAADWDAVVVEDDYDSELRYDRPPSPSLASLDDAGRTVYLGTFSKLLSPGLRLGYLVAPEALAEAVRDLIRLTVRQVPGLMQRAMALFIQNGDYARAVARQREELHRRWSAATAAAHDHLPVEHAFPSGGSSLWLQTSGGIDWRDVMGPAAERGVLLQPPEHHWAEPAPPLTSLRLGFAALPAERIPEGVAQLGMAYRSVAARSARRP